MARISAFTAAVLAVVCFAAAASAQVAPAKAAPKAAPKAAAAGAAAVTGDATKPVRQIFLWSLTGGVAAAPAAKATRTALYAQWNKANPKSAVTTYWLAPQVDELLHAAKDSSWADFGGFTDFTNYAQYDEFKDWEKAQPTYKALPVTTRTRLVSYL